MLTYMCATENRHRVTSLVKAKQRDDPYFFEFVQEKPKTIFGAKTGRILVLPRPWLQTSAQAIIQGRELAKAIPYGAGVSFYW